MLADAILMTERQRTQRKQDASKSVLEADIGDLLISGVEMAWTLQRR